MKNANLVICKTFDTALIRFYSFILIIYICIFMLYHPILHPYITSLLYHSCYTKLYQTPYRKELIAFLLRGNTATELVLNSYYTFTIIINILYGKIAVYLQNVTCLKVHQATLFSLLIFFILVSMNESSLCPLVACRIKIHFASS